jgi:hypothetical protein
MSTRKEYEEYFEDVKHDLGWVEIEHLQNIVGRNAHLHLLEDIADGKVCVVKGNANEDHETWSRDKNGEDTIVLLECSVEEANRQTHDDYFDYAREHIDDWDAIPCEFVTRHGELWDVDTCWKMAEHMGLLSLLSQFEDDDEVE